MAQPNVTRSGAYAHAGDAVRAVPSRAPLPVRRIGVPDLIDALQRGADDFWAHPTHLVFLFMIYPLTGFFLFRLIFGYQVFPLLFPLITGFALIGPFAATGLYELSRRREMGFDAHWSHAFDVLRSPALGGILRLGFILLFLFFTWLIAASAIYRLTLGDYEPAGLGELLRTAVSTPAGWALILFGNLIGLTFACLVLAISVVSFPLLLDRAVGVMVAVRTSIAAVQTNPMPMAIWGLIVIAAILIGSLPLLVGLAIVVPVLGHATWHLYRRLVVVDDAPARAFAEHDG
jgi:uncharacterized membrane protein